MAITGTGQVKRNEFLLFANVGTKTAPEWEVIGKDLESLTIEMNNEVETTNNILGETNTTVTKGNRTSSVSPYKVRKDSELGKKLYEMSRNDSELSDVEMEFLQVFVFDEVGTGIYAADKQTAAIDIKSYGGDTKGLDIPFDLNFIGAKTDGSFKVSTSEFTPTPTT